MIAFTIVRKRADGAPGYYKSQLDATDIDDAARIAVSNCPDDQYVIAVIQTDENEII